MISDGATIPKMIQLFQPQMADDELRAVKEVFASNWIGRGRKVEEFERKFAEHLHILPEHVVSVSCATEGLFQALVLLNICPGDEVILPSISFVGTYNAIVNRGATPVFCDVDEFTLNPTAAMIEAKITKKTMAVIILHYGGHPCNDMAAVMDLCREEGIELIEDSACSPASRTAGYPCGTMGDIGIWSFDAMKVISCGDGGMIWCPDDDRMKRLRKQLYLGISEQSGLASKDDEWWKFEVEIPGARRAIMNDITASIGIVQLGKLKEFVDKRFQLWKVYNNQLQGLDWLTLPPRSEPWQGSESSYYFYWVQCDRRDELANYLRKHGVYTTFRYYPLHWATKSNDNLPGTERAASRTLLLPLHQSLQLHEVVKICELVREFGTIKRQKIVGVKCEFMD